MSYRTSLLNQLEEFFDKDEPFAVEIIRMVSSNDEKFLNILRNILKSDSISNEFRKYIKKVIRFYTGKTKSLSSPMVNFTENGNSVLWN